ncbi:bifunctional tetrahydrofolate synthase/dihydrofolate synthase [Marinobacter salicampi]|uniref:bifunctional tetrahydrofolate synthase/dihydrofolate synthase n=1 Tax=Marinobacter salicampi TaxID=435907 RepID=UPI00140D2D96|nr:bifunctional tetrahydrofolate synthase/dihydrofolate synthase [Marinobacter salicampi]
MKPLNNNTVGPVTPGPDSSLDDWLSYLEAVHPSEIDLGLDRVLTVLRRLMPGRPGARIITVGGTNGKGSTVACLEALLLRADRKVGAYTSPHLLRYNERIRINGRDVPDSAIIDAFVRIQAARGSVSLTYFEFGTLAAFLVMEAAGVEDWLLEVGLGGRLDAVNVLDADLAIITSVDIDHAAWLGNDRESIGFEKAGILRVNRPAIFGDLDPPRSVVQQARAQRVSLWRLGEEYWISHDGCQVEVPAANRRIPLPLMPLPVTSVAAAVRAALWLAPELSDKIIFDALARVRVPGRFERLRAEPAIFVDVGHNPHAATWLADRVEAARAEAGGGATGRVFGIYACLTDKDARGVVSALANTVNHWLLTGLDVPRGLDTDVLVQRLEGLLPENGYEICQSVTEAIDRALVQARPEDVLIIFGSFYTVASARSYLLGS